MGKINLICLPFAGGNRYSYRKYQELAEDRFNIMPLECAGRGRRINERPSTDINDMVDDLYAQIEQLVHRGKYAVYGHSMGGLMAYLLVRKIILHKLPPPLHIFITGTTGPSAPSREEKQRHLLDKQAFIEELKVLNGFPHEILEDEEMIDYFEPILRSDFKACETYVHIESRPLDVPITVVTGTEEDMEAEDILLWQKETSETVDFRQMPGNHFFIFEFAPAIIDIISEKLFTHT